MLFLTRLLSFLFAIALLAFPTTSVATNLNADKLQTIAERYLQHHATEEHISAVSISVLSTAHKIPLTVYVGSSDITQENHLHANSLFQMGSITKSFITAVLLQLASNPANHFSLNDSINKFFPAYERWHVITIKELMNMTSGIPDYFSDNAIFTEYTAHPYQQQHPEQWVNTMYQQSLHFNPGTQFEYSNTNYLLLGMVIEKITGHPIADVIQQHLLKPLGLKHTYFVPHEPASTLLPYLVHGYQYQHGYDDDISAGSDVTHYSLSYLGAAGALISTSNDMAIWINDLFTPGKVLPPKEFNELISLVSENTGNPTSHLSSTDTDGYGLGISAKYEKQWHEQVYIYFGMTLGYRALFMYFPKQHTTIVLNVNSGFDIKKNHLLGLGNRVGNVVNAQG